MGSSPKGKAALFNFDGNPLNGYCPSCGFPMENPGDRYCELCTFARRQETIQRIISRAYRDRPANEDAIRGVK